MAKTFFCRVPVFNINIKLCVSLSSTNEVASRWQLTNINAKQFHYCSRKAVLLQTTARKINQTVLLKWLPIIWTAQNPPARSLISDDLISGDVVLCYIIRCSEEIVPNSRWRKRQVSTAWTKAKTSICQGAVNASTVSDNQGASTSSI